ncbi:hypothetical protein, partial [Chlamydia ibidis]
MKRLNLWLLMSSTLITTSQLCFAQAQNIGPSNGCSGSSSFTTLNANEYNCSGDIHFSNLSLTSSNNSCFCPTTTSSGLTLTGNGGCLCFEYITNADTSKPAAIEVGGSNQPLSVSGFSNFVCMYCPTTATNKCYGAVKVSGQATFNNNTAIKFQNNCCLTSSQCGGAICCAGLTLKNTSDSVVFANNKAEQDGGAISSTAAMTISNNNSILFANNIAKTSGNGGAINSSDSITISNNGNVIFSDNDASQGTSGKGGAISCITSSKTLNFSGNSGLTFANNIAKEKGGAIATDSLNLIADGPTLFTGNTVINTTEGSGGAIAITGTNGTCTLHAQAGDIIFDANTLVKTGSSSSKKRNAIDLSTSNGAVTLKSKEGYGIYFYDPISGTGTGTVTINDASHTGSVVFSGEKLSAEEAKVADNLKSSLGQAVTLSKGTLILKDGVTLQAKSITQSDNTSTTIMDLGTTLIATDSGSSNSVLSLPN